MTENSNNKPGEALKFDGQKNMVELLPSESLEEIAKVLTFGAQKYDEENWRKGMNWKRLIGATLRHIYAWGRGENKDPESGLSHLAHAGCCILFLLSYEETKTGTDDRFVHSFIKPTPLSKDKMGVEREKEYKGDKLTVIFTKKDQTKVKQSFVDQIELDNFLGNMTEPIQSYMILRQDPDE